VAHPIDGAEHGVGLAEDPSEPRGAVVDPAIVVDELAVRLVNETAEVTDEPRPASDVRDAPAAEVEQWLESANARDAGAEHVTEGLALRSEVPDARVELVPGAPQLRGLAFELHPSSTFRMTVPGRVFELALEDFDPHLELSEGLTSAERMDSGPGFDQLLLGCP